MMGHGAKSGGSKQGLTAPSPLAYDLAEDEEDRLVADHKTSRPKGRKDSPFGGEDTGREGSYPAWHR